MGVVLRHRDHVQPTDQRASSPPPTTAYLLQATKLTGSNLSVYNIRLLFWSVIIRGTLARSIPHLNIPLNLESAMLLVRNKYISLTGLGGRTTKINGFEGPS